MGFIIFLYNLIGVDFFESYEIGLFFFCFKIFGILLFFLGFRMYRKYN